MNKVWGMLLSIVLPILLILAVVLVPNNFGIQNASYRVIRTLIIILSIFLIIRYIVKYLMKERDTKSTELNQKYEKTRQDVYNRLMEAEMANAPLKADGEDSVDAVFVEAMSNTVVSLDKYYDLVNDQLANSFIVALVVCTIGFLIIGLPMIFSSFGSEVVKVNNLTIFSGIITEIIGALFFYLYNRAGEKVEGYSAKLLKLQFSLVAYKYAKDIKDETEKCKLITNLINQLMNMS